MGNGQTLSLQRRGLKVAGDVPLYLAATLLALLAAAAVTVVARRFADALQTPLQPAALCVIALLVGAASIAIHLALPAPAVRTGRVVGFALMAMTSLAVVALALGICLPGTPTIGAFFLCILLLAEQSWAWARYVRRVSTWSPEPACLAAPRKSRANGRSMSVPSESLLQDADATVGNENVTQHLVRTQADDGAEQICGRLRIAFAAGQRTGSVHVAFCPPLAATPELEIEQLDGPTARIKTAQLLPYGARLDLKLAAATEEPSNVLLHFAVCTRRREETEAR